MSRSTPPGALVLALLLAAVPRAAQAQPAFQVADIGTTVTDWLPQSSRVSSALLAGVTYIGLDDEIHGDELWRSDGTAAGTTLVKDLCPGSCWGVHSRLVVVGSLLYFLGSDGERTTLFRTDGTAAGTVPVFLSSSALGQKLFYPFAELGGKLLLALPNTALGQTELWSTDGTGAGTAMVKSLGPLPGPSYFPGPVRIGRLGATLFFSNDDGVHGREPWKTDGTSAGTALVKDVFPGGTGSITVTPFSGPQDLPVIGGSLLFPACDDTHGCALWKSDGTTAGTTLIRALSPVGLANWNGEAVFAGDDGSGSGLFKSDGTAAGTVRVGPPLSIGEIAVAGLRIFFTACDLTATCRL
jgi:ELWxxDGT repeat protein